MLQAGCTSKKDRVTLYYKQVSSGTTTRATAAAAMAADWRAEKILLDDAMNLAFEHIEKDADAASLEFAGAVLDFAAQVQREIPQGDEFLLMYFRFGGLAGQSATVAYNNGDFATGRSLVLSGPGKWQSDAYWDRHPNHDALVGRLMFLTGEESQALRWLRRHDVMDDELRRAHDEITEAQRARGGNPSAPVTPPANGDGSK